MKASAFAYARATSIANALYDLESNIPDMKSALRPLQFVSAREVR